MLPNLLFRKVCKGPPLSSCDLFQEAAQSLGLRHGPCNIVPEHAMLSCVREARMSPIKARFNKKNNFLLHKSNCDGFAAKLFQPLTLALETSHCVLEDEIPVHATTKACS